ncbi:hypothetical protein [Azonexus fungiphilus]|uniref:hypothetical protein n=1 Tax=Azonexus fungiphilus TaxID=146940 RepID=UPI00156A8321|nr:hypothetical protein [Azonexus fungiphilus]NHC05912.1 hypothetical protein [Azonexus fungiphilus]
MSETTIPTRLLVEQLEVTISIALSLATTAERICRENKLDYLAANQEIHAARRRIEVVAGVIEAALAPLNDLLQVRLYVREQRKEACSRIQSMLDALRAECLLNGPAERRAA